MRFTRRHVSHVVGGLLSTVCHLGHVTHEDGLPIDDAGDDAAHVFG
jgi:hypothetical protein